MLYLLIVFKFFIKYNKRWMSFILFFNSAKMLNISFHFYIDFFIYDVQTLNQRKIIENKMI
jgi:hypothetical protein